jgi:hypothetical protein
VGSLLRTRAVTPPYMCLPIPESLDDVTVAAIMNPGMSQQRTGGPRG